MGDIVFVFDIDGVVIDSKMAKRTAWHDVFADRSFVDNQMLETMVDAKVGDRYAIIRCAFERIGTDPEAIDALVERYADRYDRLVRLKVRERGLFYGAARTLEALSSRHALYANSKTPQSALVSVLEEFGIAGHFREILGSSRTKAENLRHVIEAERAVPGSVVMVGDEDGDRIAASEVGCVFVGIADEVNRWIDGKEPFMVLRRVADIEWRISRSRP